MRLKESVKISFQLLSYLFDDFGISKLLLRSVKRLAIQFKLSSCSKICWSKLEDIEDVKDSLLDLKSDDVLVRSTNNCTNRIKGWVIGMYSLIGNSN